jgi:hypothetical protein
MQLKYCLVIYIRLGLFIFANRVPLFYVDINDCKSEIQFTQLLCWHVIQ